MKSFSPLPAIALLCLVHCTFTYSQNNKHVWDAGIRIASEMHNLQNSIPVNGRTPFFGEKGILAGFYGTYYFKNRWSLRGEFNYQQIAVANQNVIYSNGAYYAIEPNQLAFNSMSFVLAPRYRVLPWLDLELALEARKQFNNQRNLDSPIVWAGAAVHLGNFELNLRYAPSYEPRSAYGTGGHANNFQLGISAPLFQGKKR